MKIEKVKKCYNIIEIPGTEKLEDIVLPAMINYINERAGRPMVRIGKEGEKTIFEEEDHPFKITLPAVINSPFSRYRVARRD